MVASDEQVAVDVLSAGGRPARLSRRVRRLLVVLLVVGLAAGWLVDRRIRAAETAAVGGCASAAAQAVDAAHGRISAMVGYVRPTLLAAPPGDLRRGLYRMVSGSTSGTSAGLVDALGTCRSVRVLPLHGDLRDRRAGCVDWVRRSLRYVDDVALDGRAAFAMSPRPRSAATCTG